MAVVDAKEIGDSLLSTTTVSFQSAVATTLYTVPTGKRCVLSFARVICGSAASTTAIITFGQVGTLTDFLGSQTMTNLAAQYDAVICMPVPHATVPVKTKSYAATTIIQCNVGTADTDGSDDATVMLYGSLY